MIKFCVEREPLPQPRPRFSRYGGVYFPQAFQAYKATISKAAVQAMAGREPLTGELKAVLKLIYLLKCVCLYLTMTNATIVYADDSQIISVVSTKHTDKDNPHIEIEIEKI